MLSFSIQINQAIRDYKLILKRQLNSTSKREKIKALGINRMALRNNDDVQLYEKANAILEELKKHIGKKERSSAAWFSGIDRFHAHLQDLLNSYHIQENRVVHNKQMVSHSLLEIIQTVKMSQNVGKMIHNQEAMNKARNTIEKYGTRKDITRAKKLLAKIQYLPE